MILIFIATQLTTEMEDNLAKCITHYSDLRHLGILGFGFEQDVINSALSDCKGDVTEAAALVIRTWSNKYKDERQAYGDLCEILKAIGRAEWIKELIANTHV